MTGSETLGAEAMESKFAEWSVQFLTQGGTVEFAKLMNGSWVGVVDDEFKEYAQEKNWQAESVASRTESALADSYNAILKLALTAPLSTAVEVESGENTAPSIFQFLISSTVK